MANRHYPNPMLIQLNGEEVRLERVHVQSAVSEAYALAIARKYQKFKSFTATWECFIGSIGADGALGQFASTAAVEFGATRKCNAMRD